MKKIFYLASHDYISSPEPRKCSLVRSVKMADGRVLYEVEIFPPLPKSLIDAENDVKTIFFAGCSGNASLADIGKQVIMVDIYHIPQPKDDIETDMIVRIGVGTLHSNHDEALKYSP